MNLQNEYERLLDIVAGEAPAAIAFSGGADSALLLKAAVDVFGDQTLALFANSILQTPDDINNAISTADKIGANLQLVEILPLNWPEFTCNPSDRCYHCKKKVYSIFKELLPPANKVLADGTNLDDLGQERPGHRAIDELGVVKPLAQAGLRKSKIRKLGRYLGVPSWDRDSGSCLATRIPSGLEITPERLQVITAYEEILGKAGFTGCRVKMTVNSSKSVKIKLKADDLGGFVDPKIRKRIAEEFRVLGICKLYLDMDGRP